MAEETKSLWITTIDNPYSPSKEWDEWCAFDEQMGYHTMCVLARLEDGILHRTGQRADEVYDLAAYELYQMMPSLYKLVRE